MTIINKLKQLIGYYHNNKCVICSSYLRPMKYKDVDNFFYKCVGCGLYGQSQMEEEQFMSPSRRYYLRRNISDDPNVSYPYRLYAGGANENNFFGEWLLELDEFDYKEFYALSAKQQDDRFDKLLLLQ